MRFNKVMGLVSLLPFFAACSESNSDVDFISKVDVSRKLTEAPIEYKTDMSRVLAEAEPTYSDVAYLIDMSGSMTDKIKTDDGESIRKVDEVAKFQFPEGADVYVFSTHHGDFEGYRITSIKPDGGTPLLSSIYQVLQAGNYHRIVALTDGENNSERVSEEEMVKLALQKRTQVKFVPVGAAKSCEEMFKRIEETTSK